MIFYIEKIKITLTEDAHGIRLTCLKDEWPLPGQSMEQSKEIITQNFAIVRKKYAEATLDVISTEELNEICLRIVLYYFYLYNSWRGVYVKEKNRDLVFQQKDFSHPHTYNKVIWFFKNKYPDDYARRCAAMLDMTPDAVLTYEAVQRDFYTAFR